MNRTQDVVALRLRGQGGSMYPTIHAGDQLEVVQKDRYSPGDVVVYIEGGGLVAHRVVCTRPGLLWTRGDACRGSCSRVPERSVCGKVVRVRRRNRILPMDHRLFNLAWLATPRAMRALGTTADLPRRLMRRFFA